MTDENDSDEILTEGGSSTVVIEKGLPFALITCRFTQIAQQTTVPCPYESAIAVRFLIWLELRLERGGF